MPSLEVRFLDRFFDNYVMTPMQRVVGNQLRPEGDRDPYGVTEAKKRLEVSYAWLEADDQGPQMGGGRDVHARPTAPPPRRCSMPTGCTRSAQSSPKLRAYRRRLLRRPSFARAVDEARPFRKFFPLGAPDRD